MSVGNVSSLEIDTASAGSAATGRGSMPRARRRSSTPTLPGRSVRQAAVVELGQQADRRHAGLGEPLLRLRADAGERAHGQRRQEGRLAARQGRR